MFVLAVFLSVTGFLSQCVNGMQNKTEQETSAHMFIQTSATQTLIHTPSETSFHALLHAVTCITLYTLMFSLLYPTLIAVTPWYTGGVESPDAGENCFSIVVIFGFYITTLSHVHLYNTLPYPHIHIFA